ncbi:unnamed protein product [Adineta steineri]|uniref:Uncharacterized protein n=1 Tax=Adineta steineri TaxID=433720 RepID=A0A814W3L8_9BILA|nr:unnamed protein product [Adineta steineri]
MTKKNKMFSEYDSSSSSSGNHTPPTTNRQFVKKKRQVTRSTGNRFNTSQSDDVQYKTLVYFALIDLALVVIQALIYPNRLMVNYLYQIFHRITSDDSTVHPGLNETHVEFPDITLENDASVITDNDDDNEQWNTSRHAAIQPDKQIQKFDMNSEENQISSSGMVSTDNNTFISANKKLKDSMSSTKVNPLIDNPKNDQPDDIDKKLIFEAICLSSDDKAEPGKDFIPNECASEEFPQGSCTMCTPGDEESSEDSCY